MVKKITSPFIKKKDVLKYYEDSGLDFVFTFTLHITIKRNICTLYNVIYHLVDDTTV